MILLSSCLKWPRDRNWFQGSDMSGTIFGHWWWKPAVAFLHLILPIALILANVFVRTEEEGEGF